MDHTLEQLGLMIASDQRRRAAKTSDLATAVRASFGADKSEFKKFIQQLASLANQDT